MTTEHIHIFSCSQADYPKLQSLDPKGFPKSFSYADWQTMIAEGMKQLNQAQVVIADIDEFENWCYSKGVPFDSRSRMMYANELGMASTK